MFSWATKRRKLVSTDKFENWRYGIIINPMSNLNNYLIYWKKSAFNKKACPHTRNLMHKKCISVMTISIRPLCLPFSRSMYLSVSLSHSVRFMRYQSRQRQYYNNKSNNNNNVQRHHSLLHAHTQQHRAEPHKIIKCNSNGKLVRNPIWLKHYYNRYTQHIYFMNENVDPIQYHNNIIIKFKVKKNTSTGIDAILAWAGWLAVDCV